MGRRPRAEGEKGSAASFLSAGAEVEVSSDDEGFRGAWYEAVVSRLLPTRRRCLVAYSSLLSDVDPSKPLEEYVPYSHMRPRPPREPAVVFALHQPVDAFHHDGWWAGVVAGVHVAGGGEAPVGYAVCFPNTREVVEFKPGDVRAHLQWDRGQWIQPEDQEEAETDFGVGDLVEVTRDKENYGAAWFSGKVVKVIKEAVFLVEYESLRADGGEPVREIVDAQYIRPFPPQPAETKGLELQDEVEAFFGDRWSPGVVSKILSESRYIVRSKFQPEEEEFDSSKLRPCQEWIKRRWVCVSLGKGRKSQYLCRTKSMVGRKRKVHSGKRSNSPISFLTSSDSDDKDRPEPQSVTGSKTEERQDLENQIESSQPCKKLKKGELLEDQLRLLDCIWMERRSRTPARADIESDAAVESPSLTCEEHEPESHSRERDAFCPNVARVSAPRLSNGQHVPSMNDVTESLADGELPSHLNEKGLKLQSQELSLYGHLSTAEGENCGGFRGPRSNAPYRRRKKLVIRAPHRQTKDSDVGAGQDERQEAGVRKRGRPKKKITRNEDYIAGCVESEQVDRTSVSAVETTNGMKDIEESGIVLGDISQGIPNCSSEQIRLECSLQAVDNEGLPANNIIGIHQASSCNPSNDDQFVKPVGSPIGVDTSINHLEVQLLPNTIMNSLGCRIEEIPDLDELHEAGLEVGSQTLQSPISEYTAAIREEPPYRSTSKEVIFKKKRTSDLSPCGSPTQKTLPFMKNSRMWESVESMEVFRIMPQQPHFRSLEQYSEDFREGMAIGFMVTFANMVTNISKLSIADPQASFEEILKGLIPLEANGFNVQRLRSRVEELLEIKWNLSQSERKKAASEGNIADLKDEKDRLDSADVGLDKTIIELEQKLARFREERASVSMQRKSIDCEIVKLQRDVQAAEEAFLLSEHQFASVLATPW